MRTGKGAALLRGLFLFSCMFSFYSSGVAAADPIDTAVMEKMAKSLQVNSAWGWTSGTDPCKSWQKVTCDNNNKVKNINIQSSGVTGSLPDDFNSLSALESISFQNNSISGPMPTFKGLINLQYAYLGNNNFTSVPAGFFSGLTSVQVGAMYFITA